MKNKVISVLSAVIFAVSQQIYPEKAVEEYPEGWLIWHSYSDYAAQDSVLYLREPNGKISEISGEFKHPMNGCFGSSPADIVFMAIDENADEWDIYRYNSFSGEIKNLTKNSGFRNEDPKFSPDGKKIVFKRGKWEHSINDFKYDLAELDLISGEVKMLTDDIYEEAMPCYSSDGRYIYYAEYKNGSSSICSYDTTDGSRNTVFEENGVTAYYPVTFGERVYFTKWVSQENRNDMIMCYDGEKTEALPFNDENFNFSDACPVDDEKMIYSCTKNGSYDLFYYDGTGEMPFEFANSSQNELGAAFYGYEKGERFIYDLCDSLLGSECPDINYDVNGDGVCDCFDMVAARKILAS